MSPNQTYIYHITHIDNLVSIVGSKGLNCVNTLHCNGNAYRDIAYESIQSRRAEKGVPLPPFGKLHDYVPFYFAPRSPMLYTINRGNVTQYKGKQREIIYLVSTVQEIQSKKIPFVFTDGHAIIEYTEFFDDVKDLGSIDWDVMNSQYWSDTDEDPDRKRRRQAEFLAFKSFPIHCVLEIGTYDSALQNEVLSIIKNEIDHVPVNRHREWYY